MIAVPAQIAESSVTVAAFSAETATSLGAVFTPDVHRLQIDPESAPQDGSLTPAGMTFQPLQQLYMRDFGPLAGFTDYSTSFENLTGWTKVSGTDAAANGTLSVAGDCIYRHSTARHMAPWATVAMEYIEGAIGPAFVAAGGGYLAAIPEGSDIVIYEDDVEIARGTHEATAPFVLKLAVAGGNSTGGFGFVTRTVYAFVNDVLIAAAGAPADDGNGGVTPGLTRNYRHTATWDQFNFGFRALSGGGQAGSLSGGAFGGWGPYNIRTLKFSDGAPYTTGDEIYIVYDWGNLGGYTNSRAALVRINIDTLEYQIVALYAYTENSLGDGTTHIWKGMNNVSIVYDLEQETFLVWWSQTACDIVEQNTIGFTNGEKNNDAFTTLPNVFGFVTFADPGVITSPTPYPLYDTRARWFPERGGVWCRTGAEWNLPSGQVRPDWYFGYGPAADVVTHSLPKPSGLPTNISIEGPHFWRVRGVDYCVWAVHNYRDVYRIDWTGNVPSLTKVGVMAKPGNINSLWDHHLILRDGVTRYGWVIADDGIRVEWNGITFAWAGGGPFFLTRATQTTVGYDRPRYTPPVLP